jgi:hypothetical protein
VIDKIKKEQRCHVKKRNIITYIKPQTSYRRITMARRYTYYSPRDNKVLYETVQPNHISRETVDKLAKIKTGYDPRIDKLEIDVRIRFE